MPFVPELKSDAKVHNALMAFNTGMERPLLDMQQVIMRSDDSPLTVAQRELIAAYVSALNRCAYCRGAHTACAVAFGVEEGLVDQLLENIDDAKIDEALKPLFRYAKKLTLDLHTVVQADADAVFAAGWSSRALYDVVSVCCVFNFMNRFTNGLGLADIPAQFGKEGEILKRGGYGVADILKLK